MSFGTPGSFPLRMVDAGLFATIVLAPLFLGGRHPVGRMVYVVLIGATTVCWLFHQTVSETRRWRLSGAELLLFGGLLLLVIQLMPLSPPTLAILSPALGEYLPAWNGQENAPGIGNWQHLSLYPTATREALVMFAAYSMLFCIVVQRVQSWDDITRLLQWIAIATIAYALLGLLQMLLSNGKFLWIYEHPSRHTDGKVKGPFANENHFAHLLSLGIGTLIWWTHRQFSANDNRRDTRLPHDTAAAERASKARTSRTQQRRRRAARGGRWGRAHRAEDGWGRTLSPICLGVAAVAGLLTFSRGGVLMLFITTCFCVASYLRYGLFGKRSLLAMLGLTGVVAIALTVYGMDSLTTELESLTSGSLEEIDQEGSRRELWAADLSAFRTSPWLGTGVGSHREVYPAHYKRFHSVEYTHAESGYVQILMECGISGILLLVAAVGLLFAWARNALRGANSSDAQAMVIAILSGIAASLIHSAWDFVWYIPACVALTVILSACLCRASQLSRFEQQPPPPLTDTASRQRRQSPDRRQPWAIATACIAVCVFGMTLTLLPAARASGPWERYVTMVYSQRMLQAGDRTAESLTNLIPELQSAVGAHPNDARMHLKLAALYLLQFEAAQQASDNKLSLAEVAETAAGQHFATKEHLLRWLSRALGENVRLLFQAQYHARRAAMLSPYQGEAYVHLSQLAFLDSPSEKDLFLKQALQVRPHHGGVLTTAAVDSARSGDWNRAVKLFRLAFQQGQLIQKRVIDALAPTQPASFFFTHLEPGLEAQLMLFNYYYHAGREADARDTAAHLLPGLAQRAASLSGREASKWWVHSGTVHERLGNPHAAAEHFTEALGQHPQNYYLHRRLATLLIELEQFEDAEQQLRWCLSRRPDDLQLKESLKRVVHEAAKAGGSTASGPSRHAKSHANPFRPLQQSPSIREEGRQL